MTDEPQAIPTPPEAVYQDAARALVGKFRVGSQNAADAYGYATTPWLRAAVDAAFAAGVAEGRRLSADDQPRDASCPDPLADAFQALFDLVETYGGERMQEQQAMWGQIEDAVQAVGEQGIAEGCRQSAVKIALEIRRELVCCHVYDEDAETERAGKRHAICFWGEAGARIAESVGRGDRG